LFLPTSSIQAQLRETPSVLITMPTPHTLTLSRSDRADDFQFVQPGDLINFVFRHAPAQAVVGLVDIVHSGVVVIRCARSQVSPDLARASPAITGAFRASPERRVALTNALKAVNLNFVVPPSDVADLSRPTALTYYNASLNEDQKMCVLCARARACVWVCVF
jgi:hypothetical protein